jgi:GNAT superfamily N-acetyltransferase
MRATFTVETPVVPSPRVAQVAGLFDLPPEEVSRLTWDVDLPLEERPWHLGLITGPSGCGKSTLARHLWPGEAARAYAWDPARSLLDDFPAALPVREVVGLLSAVGFSSPPAWLRPFRVLSAGQQFRVTLARLLAEAVADPRPGGLIVLDEYSSVVDRTVARVGSAALARALRARGLRFVAVTCHDDVEEWLQPDWVYRPAENAFAWRCLRRRPDVELRVVRCQASAWPLFAPHHYLSGRLVPSAVCFLATWRRRPVAFSAWLPFVGAGPPARREHRTVVLPDYQGIGIGMALSGLVASLWRGLGLRALSTTTHPALIRARLRSPHWRLRRAPSLASGPGRLRRLRHATTRLTAGFEYVGPAMPAEQARELLAG